MSRRVVAAIDIGASSGRVMAGIIDGGRVALDPVHRFPNGAVKIDGHLRWNISAVFEQVLVGLTALAARYPEVESIGVDTWAIDYGLLTREGRLLAEPISHRDSRTEVAVRKVHDRLTAAELFEIHGLQFLPFTTLYQLFVEGRGPHWKDTAHVALIPDLLAFWLTGVLRTEYTNATTTGLVDVRTGRWSMRLIDRLVLRHSMLTAIDQPGSTRGFLLAAIAERVGLPQSTVVTSVGSHDTASAVVAVPATSPNFAYIISGTWSLVGVELTAPVITEAACAANFTNEAGVDGRTRFLRNVGGLWLLQECLRTWAEQGSPHDLTQLLDDAASIRAGGPLIDVDDIALIAPDDMPARIDAAIIAAGGRPLANAAALTRCILDSLAAAYSRTVQKASALSGQPLDVIHVVGGGSQNGLLCQLTANATGLPVIAGPVEAAALGNALVQARAIGAVDGSLEDLRAIVVASTELMRFEPC
jgi:rhamnulokinase